jgi:hypothetical protein
MPEPRCTHCGASITDDNDFNHGWVVPCASCHTPHYLWADHARFADIPKPTFNPFRRFNIDQQPDGVAIRYLKWEIAASLVIGFFWFIWFILASAFPAPWMVADVYITSNPILILIWVIYLMFIVASLMVVYTLLRLLINRTTILLTSKSIQVSDRPLPPVWRFFFKNPLTLKIVPKLADRDFSRKQIMDISAIEQVNTVVYFVSDGEGGGHDEFKVQVENHNGAVLVLIDGLTTHEQGLFIEMGIKQLYHIETQPHPALGIFQFSD